MGCLLHDASWLILKVLNCDEAIKVEFIINQYKGATPSNSCPHYIFHEP